MSSPRRRERASPIRNLDDKSPYRSRKLHTILEEDRYEISNLPSVSTASNILQRQNRVLNDKVKDYADEAYHRSIENSQLRRENQILKESSCSPGVYLNQERLSRELLAKETENERLRADYLILKESYEKDLSALNIENESLRKQVSTLEEKIYVEAAEVKQKYTLMAIENTDFAKKAFMEDLRKVMSSLEFTKSLLAEKEHEVRSLTALSQEASQNHYKHIEDLLSENNLLRSKINQTEIKMNNEVKQAEVQRELEKSRTQGIISYSRESNAYMEKYVRELAESLLEKNISIESFTKDIIKLKKNLQSTEKRYEEKLYRSELEKIQDIQELETSLVKMENFYKQEIAEMSCREMELRESLLTRENELENLQRELAHEKEVILLKEKQLEELKDSLHRLHEEHANQISKVMSESRVKRRSMKNLSEISSMRELSADGGSPVKRPLMRQNSIMDQPAGSSGQLYTVHEEMAHSKLIPGQEEDDGDVEIKELILHYENIIEQLKSNKILELKLANDKIDRLNETLREKQQEILEILERFSPLMEFKINSPPLEEERKAKIEKHLKADISLLGVILDKHKIAALSSK